MQLDFYWKRWIFRSQALYWRVISLKFSIVWSCLVRNIVSYINLVADNGCLLRCKFHSRLLEIWNFFVVVRSLWKIYSLKISPFDVNFYFTEKVNLSILWQNCASSGHFGVNQLETVSLNSSWSRISFAGLRRRGSRNRLMCVMHSATERWKSGI